jgi:integrase/recombinase XerD
MFKVVKRINKRITSGQVIRAAVIGHWLKKYNVRIVQYMAGYKYVSSTERYDLFNLEDLEDGLRNYHSLK